MKRSKKGFVTPYKDGIAPPNDSSQPLTTKTSATSITTTTSNNKATSVIPKVSSSPSPITTSSPPIKSTKIKDNSSKNSINDSNDNSSNSSNSNNSENVYFKIFWYNKTTKKHNTQNDGYLVYNESKTQFNLYDDTGKDIGRSSLLNIVDVVSGFKTTISSKVVEVEKKVSQSEYEKVVGQSSSSSSSSSSAVVKDSKLKLKSKKKEEEQQEEEISPSVSLKSTLKKEFKSHTTLEEQKMGKKVVSRFDPNSKDALILYTPPESQLDENGNKVVHVIVDPYIAQHLRPHQQRGVKFLYDCVTGSNNQENYTGALLADQMGLGKTLQTLALIWTLLKQSPTGKATIKKAIIVTPSTLVNNWKKEIQKWFGIDRLIATTLTDSLSKETKTNLDNFNTSIKPVLIISYEQCRIFAKILETMSCGLLVCDEAHRLKNSNSKTTMAINSIKADRKILLTGTPIQNDLVEFYSMMDFCNPGSLGSLASFKKEFINPINKSRESSNINSKEFQIGTQKSIELSNLTRPFILRRKSNVLEKYLPTKRVQVVFCRLSPLQQDLYKAILNSNSVQSLINGNKESSSASSLSTITLLKKLCNSPSLLVDTQDDDIQSIFKQYSYNGGGSTLSMDNESGKLLFVESLIKQLKSIGEKLVLVSNYTQTLDVFEKLCKSLSIDFLRLDGSVNPDIRQSLVDKFNDQSNKKYQIFLLSAKAGGVGINLIGGNHLVLYDPDWNPAIDIQAMERVWREGQVKPVFIYRLFSTGTIEEKIYQRQLMKESISNSIVDKKFNDNGGGFSLEDLKDIFSFNSNTNSDTHDLLQCKCGSISANGGINSSNKKSQLFKTIQHLDKWEHYEDLSTLKSDCAHDTQLKKIKLNQESLVSFIFVSKTSKPSSDYEEDERDEISFLEVESGVNDEEEEADSGNSNSKEDELDQENPKKRSKRQTESGSNQVATNGSGGGKLNDDGDELEEEMVQSIKRKRVRPSILDGDDNLSDLDMN